MLADWPRLRLTRHNPLGDERIGLTVWWGNQYRGWTGKPVAPWKWNRTWSITFVSRRESEPES